MNKTVRIIRTYEVSVTAEYGDDEQSLEAKGAAAVTSSSNFTEVAVLLPDPETAPLTVAKPTKEK